MTEEQKDAYIEHLEKRLWGELYLSAFSHPDDRESAKRYADKMLGASRAKHEAK